jgi:hypothetical protein
MNPGNQPTHHTSKGTALNHPKNNARLAGDFVFIGPAGVDVA